MFAWQYDDDFKNFMREQRKHHPVEFDAIAQWMYNFFHWYTESLVK